jgi:heat shock protein HtpX
MNQKQWIAHDEAADKSAALIKKINGSLVAIPIILSLVIGIVVGQLVVLPIVGLVIGVVLQRAVVSSSHSAFAEVVDAPLASESAHARVFNVVDGLCVVSGDQRPTLVLLDTTYPVAVAAVDAHGDNVIGVSQQFVNVMTRVETEAVMAHLLWRLRVGHARLVAYLDGLHRVLSVVGLGGVAQKFVTQALGSELLTIADIAACQATRFPPAAVSALEKCEQSTGSFACGAGDILSFALPTDHGGSTTSVLKVRNLSISRPLLQERIAILKEM